MLLAQTALAALPDPEQIHIDVINSLDNTTGEIFERQITETLLDFKGTLHRLDALPDHQVSNKPFSALILIGDDALSSMAEWPTGYDIILAVHVNPERFLDKQQNLPTPENTHITALFSGASIEHQLRLASLLMPRAPAWIVPFQPEQQSMLEAVLQQAPKTMALQPYKWLGGPEAIKGFQVPLRTSDAVLALSNLGAVNPETIRSLLLSAYRQGKPVIGMDAAYVRSGVLAAIDTSTEQYTLEAERILRDWLAGKPLPEAGHPRTFSVHINARVAQSLDLILPDAQTLTETLQQQEATP